MDWKKLDKVLRVYDKKFGSFPTIPYLKRNGAEWCMNVAQKCLESGKDGYEMGFFDPVPLEDMID